MIELLELICFLVDIYLKLNVIIPYSHPEEMTNGGFFRARTLLNHFGGRWFYPHDLESDKRPAMNTAKKDFMEDFDND